MRKVINIVVLVCVLWTTCVFADNTERIKELTNEATQLQQNLTRYQQTIQNIQVRIIQVNAILAELRKQDLKVTEKKDTE